jgi:hypothetical protein
MQIRIRETEQVMYEGEFRTLFPNTSLPQQLTETIINDLGADVVFEGPQATGGTRYQFSHSSGVEQIDGKWYTKYVLGPVFTDISATETTPAQTAAEQEAAYIAQIDANQSAGIRQDRDARLASSDWTQVDDSPISNVVKSQWATYRQALRDIPVQTGFPWEVIWPTTP